MRTDTGVLGEIIERQLAILIEYHHCVEQVFQFADVPGPVVILKSFPDSNGNSWDQLAVTLGQLLEEVIAKLQDIFFAALAQSREPYRPDFQTKEQIAAKLPSFHFLP